MDYTNLSLDDLKKSLPKEKKQQIEKSSNQRGKNRRGNRSRGRSNYRARNRSGGRPIRNRSSSATFFRNKHQPYNARQIREDKKKSESKTTGGKITITNLHYDVLEEELTELFSTVGVVSGVKVIYETNGRSSGKAIVSFESGEIARQAMEQFHGKSIDGEAMAITMTPTKKLPQKMDHGFKRNRRGNRDRRGDSRRGYRKKNSGEHSGGFNRMDVDDISIKVSW
eukprot:TRINITY_DN2127_c0_g2_i1.p1 TRINITY_DN2127_c0_g2~~TRINITY_DN2127_c0_g2_i1.p1  ORF type:complete len:239 (+),score=67.13 TRINITY_DN2127_c0_g2_i1:45-719(+)